MTTTAPLDQPLYGAGFGEAFSRAFRKYGTFSGRASRSEYWWWQLATAVVSGLLLALAITLGVITGEPSPSGGVYFGPLAGVGFALLGVWVVGTIIPHLAVLVRRLHDANLPGPMFLIGAIPGIGDLIVLILTLLPSNPDGARFDRA